jgi:hypothetical protein
VLLNLSGLLRTGPISITVDVQRSTSRICKSCFFNSGAGHRQVNSTSRAMSFYIAPEMIDHSRKTRHENIAVVPPKQTGSIDAFAIILFHTKIIPVSCVDSLAINAQSVSDHPAAECLMRDRAAMMLRQLLGRGNSRMLSPRSPSRRFPILSDIWADTASPRGRVMPTVLVGLAAFPRG